MWIDIFGVASYSQTLSNLPIKGCFKDSARHKVISLKPWAPVVFWAQFWKCGDLKKLQYSLNNHVKKIGEPTLIQSHPPRMLVKSSIHPRSMTHRRVKAQITSNNSDFGFFRIPKFTSVMRVGCQYLILQKSTFRIRGLG